MSGEYIIFHIAPPVEGKKGTKQGWRVRELFPSIFFGPSLCVSFFSYVFFSCEQLTTRRKRKRGEKKGKKVFSTLVNCCFDATREVLLTLKDSF